MVQTGNDVRSLLGVGVAVAVASAALLALLATREFPRVPIEESTVREAAIAAWPAQPATNLPAKKAPWPPGWSDDDRLKAAAVLRREADLTYFATRGSPPLPGRLSLYFRYRKLLRLYANCASPPAPACREIDARVKEIEPAILQREQELLAQVEERRVDQDLEGARRGVRELCALYPEDGTDAAPMTRHGDGEKHAHYLALDLRLEDLLTPSRHAEWEGKPIGVAQALQIFQEAFEKRFLDRARNYDAQRVFRAARTAPAEDKPAPSLVDELDAFLLTCTRDGANFLATDWKALERRARTIGLRPEAAGLGEVLVAWTRAEAAAQECVGAYGRPPRGRSPEEYFAVLARVPDDSVYHAYAIGKRRVLKDSFLMRAASEAADLADSADYRAALERINLLLITLDGAFPEVVERLDPQIESCERNLKYQDLLNEAETAVAEGRLIEAERVLASLDAGVPEAIALKSSGLKAELPTRRALGAAKSFYDAGDGPRAVEALHDATDPDLLSLRERIEKVVELNRSAEESVRRHQDNTAILQWMEILELEPDDANAYRRAITVNPSVKAQCLEPAEREYAAGASSLEGADWASAREHLDEALRLFPNHAAALRAIQEFCREAERDFNSDMAMYYKGDMGYEMIRAKFEGVLQFLRPADGEAFRSYRDAYDHLQPRMPGGGGKQK